MVDYFALALSHGLLALAVWRLMLRPDLDSDPAEPAEGEAVSPPAGKRGRRA
jgi:hypothetical protein